MEASAYPGIWVQFDDSQEMERAGIAQVETVIDDDGIQQQVTRWKFGGNLVLTVAALSSQERDRLFDEVVRVIAFSGLDQTPAGGFKALIENNDLIGININYDVLTPSGDAANPGTPWNTNEVIYEKTVSVAMIGEFVSDPQTNILYPLSKVVFQGWPISDAPPDILMDEDGADQSPYDPTQWV